MPCERLSRQIQRMRNNMFLGIPWKYVHARLTCPVISLPTHNLRFLNMAPNNDSWALSPAGRTDSDGLIWVIFVSLL